MKNVFAVSITRLYEAFVAEKGRNPSVDEIYDMARWAWRSSKAGSCQLVFACAKGTVKGVFEVQEWFFCGEAGRRPELRPDEPEGSRRYHEIAKDIEEDQRIAFVGKVADCANQFIGKKAPRLCGPIGYTMVNC